METLASRLAAWLADLTPARVPAEVLQRARDCVLDQIGCQIVGAGLSHVAPVLAHVRSLGAAPQASITMSGERTTPIYAAYVNGSFGHSMEFDDSHVMCGHPGAVVIPAAFAIAERDKRSGADLLCAIVAGYQAMAIGGGAVHKSARHRGWHPMKMQGPFGAAGGVANLLGIETEKITHALAIAGSEASGTMEYDQSGGEVKRLHAGSASRSGAQAALLAQAGLTGPPTIFEGKRGIFRVFADRLDCDPEEIWKRDFHLRDTMFKLSPAVFTIHGAIQAAEAIVKAHQPQHGEIEQIVASVAEITILHGAGIVHPHDMIGAQFSLQFAVACVFVRGHVRLEDFADLGAWNDPAIRRLASLIDVRQADVAPGASELGGRISVRLRDGASFEHNQPVPRGHHLNPASSADIVEKFYGLVGGVIDRRRADQIVETVSRLEQLENCASLADFVRAPSRFADLG